jgi:hypothetical protein
VKSQWKHQRKSTFREIEEPGEERGAAVNTVNIGDTLCGNCGHKKSDHTQERGYKGGCVVCACNGFYLDGDGQPKYGVGGVADD